MRTFACGEYEIGTLSPLSTEILHTFRYVLGGFVMAC